MSTSLQSSEMVHSSEEVSGTLQLVSFRLAGEEYGIAITKVREIILMGEITHVPQAPAYVKGVINLRSTVLPVVDLRVRFGLTEGEASSETRIIVVNVGPRVVGVVVDAVSEVLRVARDQIAPPPPTVTTLGNEYLTGLVKLPNRLLTLLDLDHLLDSDDHAALEQATAR